MAAEKVRVLEERIASGRYSPEQVAKARAWIDGYQAQVASAGASGLGDPRALSGAEALGENPYMQTTKRVVTPGAPAEEEYVVEPRRKAQFEDDLPEQAEPDPVVGLEAEAAAHLERAQATEERAKLPNLSKEDDPRLLRPPEWKGEGGMYSSPLSAIPFVGQRIWYEPTADQFRRDMGKQVPGALDADDDFVRSMPEYQRYADAKWAQAYDAARQNGTPIARQSQMSSDWGEKAVLGAFKHVASGALGADEALTGGLITEGVSSLGGDEEVENTRALRESSPVARVTGNVVGALNPMSLTSKLAGAGIRATGAGAAQGARALRAAGAGAITGAGEVGAQEAIRLGSDALRGEDVSQELDESGERVLAGAALGGVIGPAADLLGRGAGKFRDHMRSRPGGGRELRQAEAAGASVSPWPLTPRFTETEAMGGLRRRALEADLDPDELVSQELVQPVARAAQSERQRTLAPVAKRLTEYQAATEGIKVEADEFGDAVLKNLSTRLQEGGLELPGVSTRSLSEAFERTFEVQHVPRADVQKAIADGMRPVDTNLQRALGLGVPGQGLVTFVRARRMNPRQLEQVIDTLSFRARPTAGVENPDKEIFKELNVAARRTRDRFPPPSEFGLKDPPSYRMPDGTEVRGYSALNAQYSELARDAGQKAVRAGLPEETRSLPQQLGSAPERARVGLDVGDEQKLRGRIANYGRKKGMVEEDAALRDFAGQAGKGEELDALSGISAVDRLNTSSEGGLGIGWTPGGFYPRMGGVAERLKLRAYPGASELSALPKSASPGAPSTADVARGALARIRSDPRLGPLARMGILPKPSDYNALGLDFGMRGGAQASGAGTAGGLEQPNDTTSAPLPDDVVEIILKRESAR